MRDLLGSITPDKAGHLVDPWNGSGTTTKVAAELGVPATGLDINPAMVVLAKARLLTGNESREAAALVGALGPDGELQTDEGDPLAAWFDEESTGLIRRVEASAREIGQIVTPAHLAVDAMSVSQAHVYAALFLAIRSLMRGFIGSNPTWVRIPRNGDERLSVPWQSLRELLIEGARALRDEAINPAKDVPEVRVKRASSRTLPADMPVAEIILGSPPYCTRIDYAVATRPELAILGMSASEQDDLRREMLGTTTVPRSGVFSLGKAGATVGVTLEKVASHPAKASAGYYWKWLAQYFSEYSASLRALARQCASSGRIVLVVQDSFYKNVHVDLAKITEEVLLLAGWRIEKRYVFEISRTMAGINPGSRRYRKQFAAREEVLVFNTTDEVPS